MSPFRTQRALKVHINPHEYFSVFSNSVTKDNSVYGTDTLDYLHMALRPRVTRHFKGACCEYANTCWQMLERNR